MIDLKEFLERKKLIIKLTEDINKPGHIVQSRNQLLAKAKGSIRQHLQKQILEQIRKKQEDRISDKTKIV